MSGCRSCSNRLFHGVGPAVAKQRSPNWLRDLLTKHIRLSADRRGRRPAVVTSVHSSARYTGARCQPTNDRQGWISWNSLVCGLAASAADVVLAWCARIAWLRWWDVRRGSELTAGSSSNHLLCRSTASCSNPAEYWWKPGSWFWRRPYSSDRHRTSERSCRSW